MIFVNVITSCMNVAYLEDCIRNLKRACMLYDFDVQTMFKFSICYKLMLYFKCARIDDLTSLMEVQQTWDAESQADGNVESLSKHGTLGARKMDMMEVLVGMR